MTTSSFIKSLCLLPCVGLLAACSDTPGFKEIRFQGSANTPATPSIVQAYKDMVGEMVDDTVEVASMDRTLHGVRQTRDTLPHPGSGGDQTAEKAFDRYQSLYFKVYKVEVVDQYQMPVSLNYDEHLAVMPNDAVHEWANRLRPTGGPNKLQVVITDASMTPAGNQHYDGRLAIEMRICSRNGTVLASVKSSAMQSAVVSGDNRKAVLNEMLARLIDSANGDLESKMARQFSPYIDRTKV